MAKALKILGLHLVAFFFLACAGLPCITHAATLNFSPSTGTGTVGRGITVSATLDTNGVVANAVDASISFPADKLRVSSISTAGSAISLWVSGPSYSNTDGTITFTGGQPRPGFNGSNVNLITITFVPKMAGTATVSYTGGSVLSGDGQATELLTGFGVANLTLNPAPPPPPPAPPAPAPEPVIIYVPVPAPAPEPAVCPPPPVCVPPSETTSDAGTPTSPTGTPTTSPSETPVTSPTSPTETPAQTPSPTSPQESPASPISAATVVQSVQTVTKTVYVNTSEALAQIQQAPEAQTTVAIATPVAVAATAASAIGLAAAVDLIPLLQYLATAPLLFFRRRTRKNYGVVYDAFTKVPVGLATVRLYSLTGHRLVASAVTDLGGRYNLLAEPGSYFLEVAKSGFVFPSLSLATAKDDGQFLDVYHGEILKVTDSSASITANVPLDRAEGTEKLLHPAKIRAQNFARKFRETAGVLGLMLSFGVFILRPGILTAVLFGIQAVIYLVVKKLGTPNKPTGWGIVYDAKSGQPVQSAAVRVFDLLNNKLLQTGITDRQGRYSFMLGPNQYIATIEKTGYLPATIRPIDLRTAKDVVPLTNHVALTQAPPQLSPVT